MYFDVDQTIRIPEARIGQAFDCAEREIIARRGRIVVRSDDLLVFSAPFWRVNGLLYLFVKQLPVGVSFGIFQVVSTDSERVVRSRISLFWLRSCIMLLLLLLLCGILADVDSLSAMWWTALVIGIAVAAAIHTVAVVEARRFFKRVFSEAGLDVTDPSH